MRCCPVGQQGSAICFLFLAVALFGALSYAFLNGSRNNLSVITNEATKTAAYEAQDCSNSISLAQKRLQARGCGDLASLHYDGSNPHKGAPTDGSCSVFHPAGGGVKPCDMSVAIGPDLCKTGPIGTACQSDGAVYIGDMDGRRIYAAPSDEAGMFIWKTSNTNTAGTKNSTDGLANTAAMDSG